MGLSNYIPNSRLSQAGVCTSTTRPASPYEGQMIYETDTNRVLVYDAAAWVMIADTDTPPGVQLVTTQTFTTQAPYDLTSVFSDSFRQYRILMEVQGNSAHTALNCQFLSGTNTPFTSANYYRYGFYVTGGGTYNPLSAATQTSMFLTNVNTVLDAPIEMTFFRPNIAARKYVFTQGFDPHSGLQIILHQQVDTNTQFTGLRFNAASGNITGRLSVYGYRD